MSAGGPTFSLSAACSGAMYSAVPNSVPLRVLMSEPVKSLATPKSQMVGSPSSLSNTLDGLRSRWTIPC